MKKHTSSQKNREESFEEKGIPSKSPRLNPNKRTKKKPQNISDWLEDEEDLTYEEYRQLFSRQGADEEE